LSNNTRGFASKGQVALVTGASTGIGLATAQALAQSGAAVVLADRNGKGLTGAVKALKDAGHQVIGCCAMSPMRHRRPPWLNVVAPLAGDYNNAGILGLMGPMMEETATGLDKVSCVNLRGEWTCMKHELLQKEILPSLCA
jgi:NAD(P)-dependent dehydrogenase (short-subunit alcohol dehydrogenase family)